MSSDEATTVRESDREPTSNDDAPLAELAQPDAGAPAEEKSAQNLPPAAADQHESPRAYSPPAKCVEMRRVAARARRAAYIDA